MAKTLASAGNRGFGLGCLMACLTAACAGEVGSDPAQSPPGPGSPTSPSAGASPRGGSAGSAGGAGSTPGPLAPPAAPGAKSDPLPPLLPATACKITLDDAPLARLTGAEYDNTIRDLLGDTSVSAVAFSADSKAGPFTSGGNASQLVLRRYLGTAEALAENALANPSKLLPCDLKAPDDACLAKFVQDFGGRAFRRPVTCEEAARYLNIYKVVKTEFGPVAGVSALVQAFLQSPNFLYKVEIGRQDAGGIVALTDYEMASRLSYTLWRSMPDSALFAAAAAGELSAQLGLRQHAQRMLSDPRSAQSLRTFNGEWLKVEELRESLKNQKMFPAFTDDLRKAMELELVEFPRHVLTEGNGSFETLLTADFTVTSHKALTTLYGGEAQGKLTKLPAGQRSGVVTSAGLMSAMAHEDQTSPIMRGVFVRENLLCQDVPSPPPGLDANPPVLNPNLTARIRFAQHSRSGDCGFCHKLIDEPGFLFENYDAVGAFQTREGKNVIDASADLVSTRDLDGRYPNIRELAKRMVKSEEVQTCFATQWFRFSLGRDPGTDDACSVRHMSEKLAKTGDMRELILALTDTPSFRYRKTAR